MELEVIEEMRIWEDTRQQKQTDETEREIKTMILSISFVSFAFS